MELRTTDGMMDALVNAKKDGWYVTYALKLVGKISDKGVRRPKGTVCVSKLVGTSLVVHGKRRFTKCSPMYRVNQQSRNIDNGRGMHGGSIVHRDLEQAANDACGQEMEVFTDMDYRAAIVANVLKLQEIRIFATEVTIAGFGLNAKVDALGVHKSGTIVVIEYKTTSSESTFNCVTGHVTGPFSAVFKNASALTGGLVQALTQELILRDFYNATYVVSNVISVSKEGVTPYHAPNKWTPENRLVIKNHLATFVGTQCLNKQYREARRRKTNNKRRQPRCPQGAMLLSDMNITKNL